MPRPDSTKTTFLLCEEHDDGLQTSTAPPPYETGVPTQPIHPTRQLGFIHRDNSGPLGGQIASLPELACIDEPISSPGNTGVTCMYYEVW